MGTIGRPQRLWIELRHAICGYAGLQRCKHSQSPPWLREGLCDWLAL